LRPFELGKDFRLRGATHGLARDVDGDYRPAPHRQQKVDRHKAARIDLRVMLNPRLVDREIMRAGSFDDAAPARDTLAPYAPWRLLSPSIASQAEHSTRRKPAPNAPSRSTRLAAIRTIARIGVLGPPC
jgi:hypothetical protein